MLLCKQLVCFIVQAWRNDPDKQHRLRECIKTAIRLMFIDSYEVPVLAMFYKEHLGELLSLRRDCEPGLLPVCFESTITLSAKLAVLLSILVSRTLSFWISCLEYAFSLSFPNKAPFTCWQIHSFGVQRYKAEELEKADVKYLPGAVVAEGRHIRLWDVLWAVHDKAFQFFELTQQQAEKIRLLQKERDMGSIQVLPISLVCSHTTLR